MCDKKLLHHICSDHMKLIVIHGEIQIEKQNMGYAHSTNEKNPLKFLNVLATVKNYQVTTLIFTKNLWISYV